MNYLWNQIQACLNAKYANKLPIQLKRIEILIDTPVCKIENCLTKQLSMSIG